MVTQGSGRGHGTGEAGEAAASPEIKGWLN